MSPTCHCVLPFPACSLILRHHLLMQKKNIPSARTCSRFAIVSVSVFLLYVQWRINHVFFFPLTPPCALHSEAFHVFHSFSFFSAFRAHQVRVRCLRNTKNFLTRPTFISSCVCMCVLARAWSAIKQLERAQEKKTSTIGAHK